MGEKMKEKVQKNLNWGKKTSRKYQPSTFMTTHQSRGVIVFATESRGGGLGRGKKGKKKGGGGLNEKEQAGR